MKDLSQCSRTCTVLAILLTNAHNFTHTQHVELLLSSGFLSELCKSVRTLLYVLHCLLSPSHSPSDRYTHMQASRDTDTNVHSSKCVCHIAAPDQEQTCSSRFHLKSWLLIQHTWKGKGTELTCDVKQPFKDRKIWKFKKYDHVTNPPRPSGKTTVSWDKKGWLATKSRALGLQGSC